MASDKATKKYQLTAPSLHLLCASVCVLPLLGCSNMQPVMELVTHISSRRDDKYMWDMCKFWAKKVDFLLHLHLKLLLDYALKCTA